MLNNCIAEYAPAAEHITLHSNEVIHHSFIANQVAKHRFGYRPESTVDFDCHLTNQRLILQPSNHSTAHPTQQFPLSEIAAFKIVRSLTFTVFAQVSFKSPDNKNLVLSIRALLGQAATADHSNRSEDFVKLGNRLLGIESSSLSQNQTAQALKAAIAQENGLVLVDFWIPECRPCQDLEKIMDDLSAVLGDRVKVIRINAEENQDIAFDYGVMSFPTILFFKSEVVVDQIVGAIPKSVVAKVLERYIQPIAIAR